MRPAPSANSDEVLNPPEIEQCAARWLQRLVQIPSVTPLQAGPRAGQPGEERIAGQLAEWFRQLGGEVEIEEVLPGRPSVYGIWQGPSARWFGVDVHTDTVGVEQMTDEPFDGRLENGRVYGRGAVDTKATLGVVLALLEWMQESGRTPAGQLLIAATADEEATATGAAALAARLRGRNLVVDQMVVAEPTLCQPVHGHKGVVRMTLRFEGQACHSSTPELGRNAVTAAARVTLAFEEEHQRLQRVSPVSPLGPGTLMVTRIQGGRGVNIVPDQCELTLDRRLVNAENAGAVRDQLIALAHAASPVPVTVERGLEINAFWQTPDSPFVRSLSQWSGQTPVIAPYCTNAWAYPATARECVVLGPGSIAQAHGATEWVATSELGKLGEIFRTWWEL